MNWQKDITMASIIRKPSVCDIRRNECLICCKLYYKELERNEISEKLERFFVALERFVGLPGNSKISRLLTPGLEVCSECTSLVESFLEDHHRWKYLELRLEWRIELLFKMLSKTKPKENDPMTQFRSEITKQCLHRRQISQPRVNLCRAQTSEQRNTSKAQSRPLGSLFDGNDIQLEFNHIADINIPETSPSATSNYENLCDESVKIENNISESSLLEPEDLPEQPNLANIPNPYNFTNKCEKLSQTGMREEDDDYSSETTSDSEIEDYPSALVHSISTEPELETNCITSPQSFEVKSLSSSEIGPNEFSVLEKSQKINVISSFKTNKFVNPLISRNSTPECQDMDFASEFVSTTGSEINAEIDSDKRRRQHASFVCKICSKSCCSKAFLQRHWRINHRKVSRLTKEITNRCHPSKWSFATHANFSAHVNKIHKRRGLQSYFKKLAANRNYITKQKSVYNFVTKIRAESESSQNIENCSKPQNVNTISASKNTVHSAVKVEKLDSKSKRNSVRVTCSICHMSILPNLLKKHCEGFHNVEGLDPSKVKHCDQSDCTAYFRTRVQKFFHKTEVHGHTPNASKLEQKSSSQTSATIQEVVKVNKTYGLRKKRKQINAEEIDEEESLNKDPEYCVGDGNSSSIESDGSFCLDEQKPDTLEQSSSASMKELATCSICKLQFGRISQKRHFNAQHNIKGMDPKQVVRCDDCAAYFRKPVQLRRHITKIHNTQEKYAAENLPEETETPTGKIERRFSCKICDKTFPMLGLLLRHKRMFHRPNSDPDKPFHYNYKTQQKMYVCPEVKCTSQYLSREQLENHQKLHGSFQCQFCSAVVDFAPDLAFHELEHVPPTWNSNDDKKVLPCSRCTSRFQLKHKLARHFCADHLNVSYGALRCPICRMPLKESKQGQKGNRNLGQHMKSIHGVNTISDPPPESAVHCDLCPAFFIKHQQLTVHKLVGHWKGHCPVCTNYTPYHRKKGRLNHLKLHMVKYHGDMMATNTPFACNVINCNARFVTQENLDMHIKEKHAQGNKFQCTQCGKQFETAQKLKNHERNLHGEANFVCQDCGKAFTSKQRLIIHYNYNHKPHEERKFKCNKCEKRFVDNAKLSRHQWRHTKEKLFVCQFCGEKFAHRHTWKRHVQNKHPQELDKLA